VRQIPIEAPMRKMDGMEQVFKKEIDEDQERLGGDT